MNGLPMKDGEVFQPEYLYTWSKQLHYLRVKLAYTDDEEARKELQKQIDTLEEAIKIRSAYD